ncbi:S41 family peptidase [Prolixibacteraceae bacterium JC049]|nr:S41 family peptidase [Prolixibacteraceae bacterium JC049]
MKWNRSKRPIILVVALLMSAAAFVGFNRDDKNFDLAKNLDIYYTLFRELNLLYVDEVQPEKLVKTSIDKMLESLDPYTTYIPESEIEDFKFMTTGDYAGIGALISKFKDDVVIAQPYEGAPAQKAGLRAGDIFLSIDGKSTTDMDTQDVSNLLKGQAGKSLEVKVRRPGIDKDKEMKFTIVREKIHIPAVPYFGMLNDKTGYIRFTNFTKDCSEDVKKAILELKEGKGAKNIVLDLRGNPGGLLWEAVRVSNLFVPKDQEIVSTRGKVKQWDKTYTAPALPVDTIIPIAVLVNSGSASASEIVAGSIQDLDRGVVIGTRTFGKGLVQTTRDLSYNAKLKVTTAKYYIPSGRCIQALDYSHRNDDGSVGKVADSLITEYSTHNGRKVFDGGGIAPDIEVKPEPLSNLTINLITKQMFFDFATRFANSHKTIASPTEFEVTDAIYAEFKQFLKKEKFTYKSRSEQLLKDLKKAAEKEKYYDMSKEQFEILASKLGTDIDKDCKQFEKEIKEMLTDEIIRRYYYRVGAIKAAIKDDKVIKEAVIVLNDKARYKSILKPKTEK